MNKIFFDHIPKTGGMSLVKVLEGICGKEAVRHFSGQSARAAYTGAADVPVVSGHFFFVPGEALPTDRFCITMLRDPLERVLSSYFFSRNSASTTLAANVKAAHSLDLEAYIECEDFAVRSNVSNAQTEHFYRLGLTEAFPPDDKQKLASAKLALEQFQLVGLQEHYRDFVDVLCYELGWPPVFDIRRENVTLRREKISEIPARLIARLHALNELDIELFEHARRIFLSHRRRIMIACIEQRNADNCRTMTAASTAKKELRPSFRESNMESGDLDFGDHGAQIVSIDLLGDLIASPQILSGEIFVCRVIFKANESIPDLTIGIHIHDGGGRLVFGTNTRLHGLKLSVTEGAEYFVDFSARCDLGTGTYSVGAALHPGSSHLERCFHWRDNVVSFEVVGQLGYHSDGAFKLHPTLDYGALDPLKGILRADPVSERTVGFQLLGHHNPALSEFGALIRVLHGESITVAAGQIFEIEIEVSNTSQCNWPSIGMRAVCISYHWLDNDGTLLVLDGKRTPLPRHILPSTTFSTWVSILAPAQTGIARLQLTLVQEHVGWFDQNGCPAVEIEVMVGSVIGR